MTIPSPAAAARELVEMLMNPQPVKCKCPLCGGEGVVAALEDEPTEPDPWERDKEDM